MACVALAWYLSSWTGLNCIGLVDIHEDYDVRMINVEVFASFMALS